MAFLFWFSVFCLGYVYVLFPVWIVLRGLIIKKPVKMDVNYRPKVSVVIAAYNEEHAIANKLDNLISLEYPADQLEIIIASDGSTDATNQIIAGYENKGVKLLALPRQGKAKTLNAAIEASSGEILVFSDANSMYRPDAVTALVSRFADPEVGGVAGNQVYRKGSAISLSGQGEQVYWSFDRFMKEMQSQSGNAISATGAIYAIRRSLFIEIPDGVTDDFITSTRVILQGYRLVFAADAVAVEPVASTGQVEFGRKVRIITRGLNGVVKMRALLNPLKFGFYSVQLFSHKVLRRLAFLPLILIAVANIFLFTTNWFYLITLIGQILFYLVAVLGWLAERSNIKSSKLISLPYFFCAVNLASLMAAINTLRGRQIALWTPQREGQEQ